MHKEPIKTLLEFYDNRYSKGYMEKWPLEKKQRIFKLINSLNLPKNGDALDFGCGNGEFAGVLKLALPEWNVYGMDISSVAINNAQKRYPDCLFFLQSDIFSVNKKFDFLFTHHVLEHVGDIHRAWCEINQCLKIQASMLHILPCSNHGSFEYKICLLHKEGIEKRSDGRFFFDDSSHLRRLNTVQMNHYVFQYNFNLCTAYYSNQLYGAFDWITLLSPNLILQITNPRQAKNKIAAIKLASLSIVLLLVKITRFPANTIDYKKKRVKKYKYYLFTLALLIFYPISKLTNIAIKYKSNLEWNKERNKENGSEMYLYYKRA